MGSSGSGASAAAQREEEQRRREIEASQRRIEQIFGSDKREGEIQDFIDAFAQSQQQELNRTHDRNERKLKFSLARAGLPGGSVDIDQNRNLSESFLRGTVEAQRRARGAGAELRDADQQSKLALFNQVLGGLDTTTAAQNAGRALQTNIGLAKNRGSEANFDRFFSQFGDLFRQRAEAEGRRASSHEFNTIYGQRPTIVQPSAGGI